MLDRSSSMEPGRAEPGNIDMSSVIEIDIISVKAALLPHLLPPIIQQCSGQSVLSLNDIKSLYLSSTSSHILFLIHKGNIPLTVQNCHQLVDNEEV